MANEFRQDPVSGEWILLAPNRAARPNEFKDSGHGHNQGQKADYSHPSACPFEDPEGHGNEVLATLPPDSGKDWKIKISKNRFPAIQPGDSVHEHMLGPYASVDGVGRQELVIYKPHDKNFADLPAGDIAEAFAVFKGRYLDMAQADFVKYVLIFHNHGPRAGASIRHPHSQIIALPILPPNIKRSMEDAENYYARNHKRIYDVILDWEKEYAKRIIYENDHFLALCPFASRSSYGIRIFPKAGLAHFEMTPDAHISDLGDIVSVVLRKMKTALNDPDYNFYIHTAPVRHVTDPGKFYTWHIELTPAIATMAAVEFGVGIVVNIADPDEEARLLRETEI